jgi:hypothetical protein
MSVEATEWERDEETTEPKTNSNEFRLTRLLFGGALAFRQITDDER